MLGFLTGLALLAIAPAAVEDGQVMQQQQQQPPQQSATDKPFKPDQMICVREEDTGSRLTSHKVCRTRSQWAQIRQEERGTIEHIQQQRPMDLNGK